MNELQQDRLPFFHKPLFFLLRTAVGWHFLYEGIAKLYTPDWTSAGYLDVSRWIFKDFFHWIAAHPTALRIVDLMNIWGLVAIGLGLILGVFARFASAAGAVLLLLYYIANPPLLGMDFGALAEGNYLVVDKNLVELFALCLLAFVPAGYLIGLDRFLVRLREKRRLSPFEEKKTEKESRKIESHPVSMERRAWLQNLVGMPFLLALAYGVVKKRNWESYEEKNLADAVTGATIKTFNFTGLKDLKGKVPSAKIKNLELSRVILGGNLIGGWAHSRDLVYVSSLVKKYHHQNKIFETLLLAEKCGVNTLLTNPVLCRVIHEYWRRDIGKIQFISDLGYSETADGLIEFVKKSVDQGACACYVHGGTADFFQAKGKIAELGKVLEHIRRQGIPGGIGAHSLDTVKGCVKEGIEPDFWMKSLHHHNYWSAKPKERNDSVFCETPDRVVEYMRDRPEPWIAFKTLAAGAIVPKDGFEYAFRNGADFVCVGMYDFQIVEDVNTAANVLAHVRKSGRERAWRA
jgi:uncharacterized membrane protein YphA (DoxX/SURF4 family)